MNRSLLRTTKHLLLTLALPAIAATESAAQRVDYYRTDYSAPNGSTFSIAQGWDNNLFITGGVYAAGSSSSDLLLIKIKPDGDTLWKRSYGSPYKHETGYCVLTPQNDEVMIAGLVEDTGRDLRSDAFLARLDAAGAMSWQKTYPIPGKSTAVVDMKRLNDGFILCGTITDSASGDTNAWLLKTDLNGNKLWSNSYGGSDYDDSWQVERTPDGGFMLAGGSYSYKTGSSHDDAWLVKTTGTGAQVWIKHYGNADTVDWIWSMAPVGNASAPTGYVFTGVKNRNPGAFASEMFLARVDTAGNIIWDVPMPGSFGYREGLSIEQTFQKTYYVACTEMDANGNPTLLTMNIDSNGKVLNQVRYPSTGQMWARPHSIFINNLSEAFVTGQHIMPGNAVRPFVAHIRDINKVTTSVRAAAASSGISVYPNPASDGCTVVSEGEDMRQIELRDATGRTVLQVRNPGASREKISLSGLPRGLYIVTVHTGGIAPINLQLTIR